jgi:hypothetical protein
LISWFIKNRIEKFRQSLPDDEKIALYRQLAGNNAELHRSQIRRRNSYGGIHPTMQ